MITCRICEKQVPALEGARCSRCRRLVCADCLASDEPRVCKDCVAEPETDAPAPPPVELSAEGGPPHALRRRPPLRPGTVAALSAVFIGGAVLALLAFVPPWRAHAALRQLRAAEGARMEALETRLVRAARGAPVTFARAMEGLPVPKHCVAIRALGRAGRVRAVPYLIRELEKGDANVRAAASQALWEITGEEFGADPGLWRNWLREQE